MGRKGWDEPGSTCLEKTQTHRIGLSEKVQKVGRGRKGSRPQKHTHEASYPESKPRQKEGR